MIPPPPKVWPGLDGTGVGCREKIRVLNENYAEASDVLRDAFEDAILMGVEEDAMRRILIAMIEGLDSPKRPS